MNYFPFFPLAQTRVTVISEKRLLFWPKTMWCRYPYKHTGESMLVLRLMMLICYRNNSAS